MSRLAIVLVLACFTLASSHAAIEDMERVDLKPCLYVLTDIGTTATERQANAQRYAERIGETSAFFLEAFKLTPKAFIDYAEFYDSPPDNRYDPLIRIRVFKRYQDFLEDYQQRYESKSVPGAFFGIIQDKDADGLPTGMWYRELATHADGISEEQVLRHIYHEMGHLFMRTFMLYPCEVPSWIEEGTAELFQYRKDNGTDSDAEREERLGFLYEMIQLPAGSLGASIGWQDFTAVRNAHNLAFTHENPLRSTIQYIQAWSVMEFMIATPQRNRSFTQLLQLIKNTARSANIQASQRRLSGAKYRNYITDRIYSKQYELFTEAYDGADILKVEDSWKSWITSSFTEQEQQNPRLHYHRGVWHLAYRARFMTGLERDAILAIAENIFTELIERSPTTPEGYVGMGRVALTQGDADTANDWFSKASELGTDNFDAQLYGGIALIQAGKADEARPLLQRAIEQRPTHAEANYQYGLILAIIGDAVDKEVALLHLANAADSRPDERSRPDLVTAVLEYQLGRYAAAARSLEAVTRAMRAHWLPPLLQASIEAAEGNTEAALKTLEQAQTARNPVAKRLAGVIQGGSLPRLGFDRQGTPGIYDLTIEEPDNSSSPEIIVE